MSAHAGTWSVQQSAAPHVRSKLAGPRLVYCASLFNLFLCFLNTRHWASVSANGVILVEVIIICVGLWCVRDQVGRATLQLVFILTLYLMGMKLLNPDVNLKILHDIAIMYVFFKLGTLSSIEQGNRTLWATMIIVLGIGAFEFLRPDDFGNVFDVWSYYVNKGVIGSDVVNYAHSNLFLSGNRGDASMRTFLPSVFGAHRISSIFLEPDSMGNFAAIGFAWCLSTRAGSSRGRILLLALCAFCVVLADSRFASICCAAMLILRQITFLRSKAFIFFTPVAVLIALTLEGSLKPMPLPALPFILDDDFTGRLLFSARVLDSWGLTQWLGASVSQVYCADTGYAYVINNLGLPFSLILLLLFALSPERRPEASWMKSMMAIYYAASLCVGASVFTIKTASILWFLYGATNALGRAVLPNQPTGAPGEGAPLRLLAPASQA